jgi:hypothetical protein
MTKLYTFKAEVRLFPQDGGWYYVSVPQEYTDELKDLADRGLVAINVTVGSSSWDSSLLPMGDGSQFIPLSAAIRRKEKIELGMVVKVSFVPR